MITVKFLTRTSELLGFSFYGHAEMAEKGKDIVCAAISSAAFMAANMITEILHINAYVNIDKKGQLLLRVQDEDQVACRDILEGLRLHLLELKKQYPESILIEYTEVK
jgi:uncharacterized protein YsxB (DUF464 family)